MIIRLNKELWDEIHELVSGSISVQGVQNYTISARYTAEVGAQDLVDATECFIVERQNIPYIALTDSNKGVDLLTGNVYDIENKVTTGTFEKEWIHETCNTNTPPTTIPAGPPVLSDYKRPLLVASCMSCVHSRLCKDGLRRCFATKEDGWIQNSLTGCCSLYEKK